MKKLFFNLYFWPVFLVVTIVGILLLPVILPVQQFFFNKTLASALRRSIRFYGWLLVCVVPFLDPVSIIDQSNGLPIPAIFTPNHCSSIDPYLFGALNVENCFVTSWPFKIPVYRSFMKLAGYINSDDGWESVKKQGIKTLLTGSSLIIWPEGHRTRDGRLLRFRNGAFKLAVETGTPILPVCVLGSDSVLPPGCRFLNPGHVKIILLPPIYPKNLCDINKAVTTLKKETKAAISAELEKNNGYSFVSSQSSEHTPAVS